MVWRHDAVSDNPCPTPEVVVSYVREDGAAVGRLVQDLRAAGFSVWWDQDMQPGCAWRDTISDRISKGDFYIPCFSRNVEQRDQTYFYEELSQAVARARQMSRRRVWMVPVRLDECTYQDIEIDSTRRLSDIHWTDVFEQRWNEGVNRLVTGLRQAFGAQAPALLPQRRRVVTTEDRAMAFLGGLYDMVAGDLHLVAHSRDVERALGWEADAGSDLIEMLSDWELVDARIGNACSITAPGIDRVEDTRATPDDERTAMHATVYAMMALAMGGAAGRYVDYAAVGEALGWSRRDFTSVCTYAEACDGIESHSGGMLRVTPHAVPAIEEQIARLVDDVPATYVVDLFAAAVERLRGVGLRHARTMRARRDRAAQFHMRFLQAAVGRYRTDLGATPYSLQALERAGADGQRYVWKVPDHPHGGSYGLDPATGCITEART